MEVSAGYVAKLLCHHWQGSAPSICIKAASQPRTLLFFLCLCFCVCRLEVPTVGEVQQDFNIEQEGSYIMTVKAGACGTVRLPNGSCSAAG